jgi:hypothetical protein
VEPNEIDFVDVDDEERSRNYAPFGGGKVEPESDEGPKRAKYEANNLMAYYSTPSDIPPNPREPSDPYNGDNFTELKTIAAPDDKWAVRAKQKKYPFNPYGAPPQAGMQNPGQGIDLSKIAGLLAPQNQQPQQQQQPAPMQNNALQDLMATLSRGQANQTATPPQPQMGGFQMPQQFHPSAPTMAPPQPAPTGQPDLAAILASITQSQGSAQPNYGYNSGAQAAPNMMSQPPPAQQQQSGIYENPERKQWRDGGASRDKRPNPYYKTKICKYWTEGKCQKGDGCTYKHEYA